MTASNSVIPTYQEYSYFLNNAQSLEPDHRKKDTFSQTGNNIETSDENKMRYRSEIVDELDHSVVDSIIEEIRKIPDTIVNSEEKSKELIDKIDYMVTKKELQDQNEEKTPVTGKELITRAKVLIDEMQNGFMKVFSDATKKYNNFTTEVNKVKGMLAGLIEMKEDSSDVILNKAELLMLINKLINDFSYLDKFMLFPNLEKENNSKQGNNTESEEEKKIREKKEAEKWIKHLGLPADSLLDVEAEIDSLEKSINNVLYGLKDKYSNDLIKRLNYDIELTEKQLKEHYLFIEDYRRDAVFVNHLNSLKKKLSDLEIKLHEAIIEELNGLVKKYDGHTETIKKLKTDVQLMEDTREKIKHKEELEKLGKSFIVTLGLSPLKEMKKNLESLGATDKVTINSAREHAWRTGFDSQFEAITTTVSILTQKTVNAKSLMDNFIKVLSDILQKEADAQLVCLR